MINPNDSEFLNSYIAADPPHEGIGGGLTKREFFALHSHGPGEDADCNYVAIAVGMPAPVNSGSESPEWSLWWFRAEAVWKVMQADALIAALAGERE